MSHLVYIHVYIAIMAPSLVLTVILFFIDLYTGNYNIMIDDFH